MWVSIFWDPVSAYFVYGIISSKHFVYAEAVGMVENWQRVVLSTPFNSGLQLHNNMLYHGNPAYPHVGDVRVSFEYAGSTLPGQEDRVRPLLCDLMTIFF